MTQHLPENHVPHRFAGILSRDPANGSVRGAIFDTILLEVDECVVTPTLGSLLPLWLLVIPRARTLNFASFERQRGTGIAQKVISRILSHYGLSPRRAIWFEHGPSHERSLVGCGVDQAHLHILIDPPFNLDELASTASATANLAWKIAAPGKVYAAVGSLSSYLVLGSHDTAYFVQEVDHIGSQFLRRQIAVLTGKPEAWNYRTYPHAENARLTIAALTGAGRKVS